MRPVTAVVVILAVAAPWYVWVGIRTDGEFLRGFFWQHNVARAVHTLMRLTHLLRGVLRPDGEFTTLGRELELVEHYLDIERERFEERLRVRLDVPQALRGVPILARTAGLIAHLREEIEKPIGFALSYQATRGVEYDGEIPPGVTVKPE